MPKNNLKKYIRGLEESTITTEQEQIDLQYLKLLKKLEVIMEKIKEKRNSVNSTEL